MGVVAAFALPCCNCNIWFLVPPLQVHHLAKVPSEELMPQASPASLAIRSSAHCCNFSWHGNHQPAGS